MESNKMVEVGDGDWAEQEGARVIDAALGERRRFLEGRQRGIGSTDIYRILMGEALDVYQEKTRPITDADVSEGSDAVDLLRGRLLEPVAAAWYRKATGRRMRREYRQFFHPDYPGAMTSADGTIFEDATRIDWQRGTGALEIKAPRSGVMQDLFTLGTRESIVMQLQDSIAVRSFTWGSYGFFCLEHSKGPLIPIDVPADNTVGKFFLETKAEFWTKHVVPRIPPDSDAWAKLRDKAPVVKMDFEAPTVELDVEEDEAHDALVKMMRLYMRASEAEKEAKEAKSQASAHITRIAAEDFKGAARYHAPGVASATRVENKGKRTFDVVGLANDRPISRDAFIRLWRENGGDFSNRDAEWLADQLRLDVERFNRRGAAFAYWLVTPAR